MYNVRTFREHILDLGNVDRARPPRTSMSGKKPHPAVETARQVAREQAEIHRNQKGSFSSRLRSFGRHRESSDEEPGSVDSTSLAMSPLTAAQVPTGGEVADPDRAGHNVAIVGLSDDPSATVETRKRAALSRGPIINLDHSLAEEYGMRESLLTALKDLFECITENESRTGVASPQHLVETLKKENELFRSSMHQDAHEFLNFLLNRVIEETDATGDDGKWVRDLFVGEFTNETRCMSCETVSRRNEQFVDFSIDLGNNTSVVDCLEQFSASEVLGGANKFYCDNCGGLQEAEKRMKVSRAPQLLTLHLKRFKFSEDAQRNVKLLDRVLYSQYLRLPVTADNCPRSDRLFELTSVIIHLGGGPYQGHYVAVTRNENGGWLLFDDEIVEAVSTRYVYRFFGDKNQLATAYVLFYQEVSQNEYTNDNILLANATPIALYPPSLVDDDETGSMMSDAVGHTVSEEDEPPSYGRRASAASFSLNVGVGSFSDSASTMASSPPSASSLSRRDSVRRGSQKLFSVFRKPSQS